ncbi:hypothetical protein BDW60DRAFT_173215, partial [Aspergillus nidulans var. acristatus]
MTVPSISFYVTLAFISILASRLLSFTALLSRIWTFLLPFPPSSRRPGYHISISSITCSVKKSCPIRQPSNRQVHLSNHRYGYLPLDFEYKQTGMRPCFQPPPKLPM